MRRFVVGLGVLGMGWVAGCLDLQTTSGTDCTAGQVQDIDPADCKQKLCNNGVFVENADDAEVPDDLNPCTVDACMDGAPKHDAVTDGDTCTIGGKAGICVAGQCEIPCTAEADCPVNTECTEHACDVSTKKCLSTPKPDGPLADDQPGDCRVPACLGGMVEFVPNDSDVADDGKPCTMDSCSNGMPVFAPLSAGTACPSGDNPSGTGKCDDAGACLGCIQPADCPAEYSCNVASNKCDSCKDAVKNGSETDVDCGGGCIDACMTGKACAVTFDCVGECDSGVCVDCFDGVKNGTEGDVDCGGICMAKCSTNQSCNVGSDCANGVCNAGKCAAPTCMDGVKNGTETDVDCGGSCPNCGAGKKCSGNMDCVNNCVNGICN